MPSGRRSGSFGPTERRALRAVATQFWVNGMVFSSFIPRLPEIRDRLDLGLGTVGLLLTLGSVGGLLGSAACGRLIERYGTRTVMVAGSVGLVATLPTIGLAPSGVAFLAALLALHFFDVLTDVTMNMQGSWLSARRSTPVMNRLHGLWSVGTVVGGGMATIAADVVSLRIHLLVVALVLLAAVVYVGPRLLVVDQRDEAAGDEPAGAVAADAADVSTRPAGRWRLPMLFAVFGALAIAIEVVPADWAAFRLTEDLGVSPGVAGVGFVASTTGMVIGRFGGDALAARIGAVRLLQLGAALSGFGLLVASVAPVPALVVVALVVAGIGAAVVFPGLYDRAASAPGRPGAVLGAMTAGIRVGLLAVPVAVGTLADLDALTVGEAMALVSVPAALVLAVVAGVTATGPRPSTP